MCSTARVVSPTVSCCRRADVTTCRVAFSILTSIELRISEVLLTRETMLWRFSAMVFMAWARAPASPPAVISRRLSSRPSATVRAKSTQARRGRITDSVMTTEKTLMTAITPRQNTTATIIFVRRLDDTRSSVVLTSLRRFSTIDVTVLLKALKRSVWIPFIRRLEVITSPFVAAGTTSSRRVFLYSSQMAFAFLMVSRLIGDSRASRTIPKRRSMSPASSLTVAAVLSAAALLMELFSVDDMNGWTSVLIW